MNILKLTLFTVFIIFNFTSCSSAIYQVEDMVNPKDGTDFSKLSNKLSVDICPKLTSYENINDIYITDFVNISDLDNSSQLGFLLSNQLKVAISSSCDQSVKIKELTLGKNIKIGKRGVKILSRDTSDIKAKSISKDGKVIIGTYAITSQKLIVYVKVVNLENGDILYSRSSTTNINDEILKLEGYGTNTTIYTPVVL